MLRPGKSISKQTLTRGHFMKKLHTAKMNRFNSISLAANFDAPILRQSKNYTRTLPANGRFQNRCRHGKGNRHSRETQNAEPAAGTVLAHWNNASRATRYYSTPAGAANSIRPWTGR